MKIDFNRVLVDFSGNPLKEETSSGSVEIKLRSVVINALMTLLEDDKNMSGDDKVKRYDLALLVHNSGAEPLDIKVEDVTLIKAQIGKFYGPLIVGQVWKILEE